jgi:hypothetical protein
MLLEVKKDLDVKRLETMDGEALCAQALADLLKEIEKHPK